MVQVLEAELVGSDGASTTPLTAWPCRRGEAAAKGEGCKTSEWVHDVFQEEGMAPAR